MRESEWIIGLDLRDRSDGAVRFARWVGERAGETAGQTAPRMRGVHVLERDKLRYVTAEQDLAQIEKMARVRMHDVVRKAGAADHIAALDLVVDADAEAKLDETARSAEAEVLLVGRKAKIGTDPVVRLGRVARRLLRALPSTVIVTPPDLQTEHVGGGPVVVATDCQDDARDAVEFALRFAELTGRKIVLVHVVPMPEEWGAHYLPTTSVTHVKHELQAGGELALERWAKDQGLHGHAGMVLQGGVLPRLIDVAEELDSPLIVTGSRGLGPVARFFLASVGSELAASAGCSVAVVPSQ